MTRRRRSSITRCLGLCALVLSITLFIWQLSDTNSNMDTFHTESYTNYVPSTLLPRPVIHDTDDDDHNISSLSRERKWQIQRQYFTLRHKRMTPYDFKVLMPAAHICADRDNNKTYLLIMCLTQYMNREKRHVIRETWGSVANGKSQWPGVSDVTFDVKLVFLLGKAETHMQNIIANEESMKYGDIVQVDFIDSYKNLTIKVLTGLRWVTNFCPNVQFILKVDDDMFIHVFNLINYLKKVTVDNRGKVFGYANGRAVVVRDDEKWAVSRKTYPMSYYPPYVYGNAYVISGNILTRLHTAAEYMPYVFIEDAFITGILRVIIGAAIEHNPEFAQHEEKRPSFCSFQNSFSIASTKVYPALAIAIWKTLYRKGVPNCRHRRIDRHPLNISGTYLFD